VKEKLLLHLTSDQRNGQGSVREVQNFSVPGTKKRRSVRTRYTMARKRKATDSISSDLPPADSVGEEIVVEPEPSEVPAATETRRSTRIRLSAAPEIPNNSRPRQTESLETGHSGRMATPQPSNGTSRSKRTHSRQASGVSQSTDEVFVDAAEQFSGTPSLVKSGEESFVTALEEIVVLREPPSQDVANGTGQETSKRSTPRPPSTQNTFVNIPSSQPPPRASRSPVPLQRTLSTSLVSVSTSAPASRPTTSSSDNKSLGESVLQLLDLPVLTTNGNSIHKETNDSDSDDEAPESIPLSQARTQALQSQSQISHQQKAHAEKGREKRRQRDRLLLHQKQEKEQRSQAEEVPDSQQSGLTEVTSGYTTDTPAPNQDHQAARMARHAEELPTSILKAASSTWLQPAEREHTEKSVSKPKRRKIKDDGIRILEDMSVQLPPKSGPIGTTKEKMIMQMGGRGERRMYIGRFTK